MIAVILLILSIITQADLGCQQWLSDALEQHWPDIPLLGEEMEQNRQAELLENSDTGLWILDPLDGTANFAGGFPHFSVSLALVRDGQVIHGVVYDPIRDECFSAESGKGAWLNGKRLDLRPSQSTLEACIAVVDFKRLPVELATALAVEPPFRSQRSLGSVALDWCWLAAGRGQIYHHGGQSLWDYAAGRLIFCEAGGVCSAPQKELTLDKQAAVAAVSNELHGAWHEWLGKW
ncbi:MAG: inositol monophosphatase [Candidatus Thiodiazotropha taylori]|nr:inositol monophosphatase [Candidatus Thiodiazotropha taylori]